MLIPLLTFLIQILAVWSGKTLNVSNALAVFGPLFTQLLWWTTLGTTATLMFFLGDSWVDLWYNVFADWGLYGSYGVIGLNLIFMIIGLAGGDTDTNSIQVDLGVGLGLYIIFEGGYIFLMYWLRDNTKAYWLAWDGQDSNSTQNEEEGFEEKGSEEVGGKDDPNPTNDEKIEIDEEGNITFPDEDPVNIEEDFFIL